MPNAAPAVDEAFNLDGKELEKLPDLNALHSDDDHEVKFVSDGSPSISE